jgi:hypothetical protein
MGASSAKLNNKADIDGSHRDLEPYNERAYNLIRHHVNEHESLTK